jgi:peptidoglycan/LPS O-acetylase OafA/YrhL
MLALLILAQDRGEQQPPDPGSGIPIILVVLALIVLAAVVLWAIFVRGARKSKGGVQPPIGESGQSHPGSPPIESVEPRS